MRGELVLTGSLASPGLLGTLSMAEGSRGRFRGNEFALSHAVLEMDEDGVRGLRIRIDAIMAALAMLAIESQRDAYPAWLKADLERVLAGLPFAVAGTYGGHSSCVEIDTGGDESIVCDMGSGLREFGLNALGRCAQGHPRTYHFFMSHLHWDHIMGFPFFGPAYVPGTLLRIHGCHGVLEEAFRRQHGAPSFPVEFDQLAAQIEFIRLEPGRRYEVAGLGVRAMLQAQVQLLWMLVQQVLDELTVHEADAALRSPQLRQQQPLMPLNWA